MRAGASGRAGSETRFLWCCRVSGPGGTFSHSHGFGFRRPPIGSIRGPGRRGVRGGESQVEGASEVVPGAEAVVARPRRRGRRGPGRRRRCRGCAARGSRPGGRSRPGRSRPPIRAESTAESLRASNPRGSAARERRRGPGPPSGRRPQEHRHPVMGSGILRLAGEHAGEVVPGPGPVAGEAGGAPGDQDLRVVGPGLQGLGEVAFGLGPAAQAREGLGVRRQHRRLAAAQPSGPGKVAFGGGRVVQLQADEGPVDQRLGEVGVQVQGPIVGRSGRGQASAGGQGLPAVQVRPGEVGGQQGAGVEVADRFLVAPASKWQTPSTNQAQNRRGSRATARARSASAPSASPRAARWVPRR
jgi:hypothetical protein